MNRGGLSKDQDKFHEKVKRELGIDLNMSYYNLYGTIFNEFLLRKGRKVVDMNFVEGRSAVREKGENNTVYYLNKPLSVYNRKKYRLVLKQIGIIDGLDYLIDTEEVA